MTRFSHHTYSLKPPSLLPCSVEVDKSCFCWGSCSRDWLILATNKTTTISPLVVHLNCRQNIQEDIGSLLILCFHKSKHTTQEQQLHHSPPASKAAPEPLSPELGTGQNKQSINTDRAQLSSRQRAFKAKQQDPGRAPSAAEMKGSQAMLRFFYRHFLGDIAPHTHPPCISNRLY